MKQGCYCYVMVHYGNYRLCFALGNIFCDEANAHFPKAVHWLSSVSIILCILVVLHLCEVRIAC